jgi:hypothetical protein
MHLLFFNSIVYILKPNNFALIYSLPEVLSMVSIIYIITTNTFIEFTDSRLLMTCPPKSSPVLMLDFGLRERGINGQEDLYSRADH